MTRTIPTSVEEMSEDELMEANKNHNKAVDLSIRLNEWFHDSNEHMAIAMMAVAMWIAAVNKCSGVPKSLATGMIQMGIDAYWEDEETDVKSH